MAKNLTYEKLFPLWSRFCDSLNFKPWISQHCYIVDLFEKGKVQGFDRGTGKTCLSVYLIAFNENFKLWKIKHVSSTKVFANKIKKSVELIYGTKITECEFVSVREKRHVESTMNIIDTNDFLITIKGD